MLSSNKISVIGLGYVGLPLAIVLSDKYEVHGYDIDKKKTIFKNNEDIVNDTNLSNIFKKNYKTSIFLNTKFKPSFINFICVSTKNKNISIENDTNLYINIIKNIVNIRIKYDLTYIVLMSTTQVGFSKKIVKYLDDNNISNKFKFLYTPERIFPSNLYFELINNNRVVGHNDTKSFKIIKKVLSTFVKGKIIGVDHSAAELIKISENTYRNINIAYANELLKICIKESININNVIKIANDHPRVNILHPGIGVGGHCIPVDPFFLITKFKDIPMIKSSVKSNENQTLFFIKKINKYIKKNQIKNVIFLGCSYKANVADLRNSPSLKLIDAITKNNNIDISVCDDVINKNFKNNFKFIKFDNLQINKFELVILLVCHDLFNNLKIDNFKSFIDLSGAYNYENINSLR